MIERELNTILVEPQFMDPEFKSRPSSYQQPTSTITPDQRQRIEEQDNITTALDQMGVTLK